MSEVINVGDRIVDKHGYLEITSINQANQVCMVKRHATSGLHRNPYIMRFSEWRKRKSEETGDVDREATGRSN